MYADIMGYACLTSHGKYLLWGVGDKVVLSERDHGFSISNQELELVYSYCGV